MNEDSSGANLTEQLPGTNYVPDGGDTYDDEDLERLTTGDTGTVLRAIAVEPYISKQHLTEAVDLDADTVESALATLEESDAVIGLTRGSGSQLESRVPEESFVLNPDCEPQLRDALDVGGTDG